MAVSMEVFTVMRFLETLLAYLVITFLMPAMLLYPKIKTMRFSVRFMTYQVTGNFFVMNLVYLLQLLRISNRYTLTLFAAVLFGAAYILLGRKHPVRAVKEAVHTFEKLAGGQLGLRLFLHHIRMTVHDAAKRCIRAFGVRIRRNFFDVLLVTALTVILLYVYGVNLVRNYGFGMSDIPVHHYWINYMVKNEIFVAGIYPMGFHCIIYFLRTVFGIPTYVLLRVFWLVQTIVIHDMLLAFIKSCCRSKYAGYIGLFLYTAASFFGIHTFMRYYSSLPQEFGMIFILPSIWFLYAFFERREKKPKENLWYLACFAMSFGMTIAVHFYNTMIAGLFCLGIAFGYGFRLFRKAAFGKVMLAGIISVFVAVLPMGVAFAMGTPLQGSLGWGLNVITGKNNKQEVQTEEFTQSTETENTEISDSFGSLEKIGGLYAGTYSTGDMGRFRAGGGIVRVSAAAPSGAGVQGDKLSGVSAEVTGGMQSAPGAESLSGAEGQRYEAVYAPPKKDPLPVRLIRIVKKLPGALWDAMCTYLIPDNYFLFRLAVPAVILLLPVLAIVFFVLKQTDYAARLMSTAVFLALMSVLFGASRAGLPSLMDAIRACIFYAYVIVMAWSLCIDAVLSLFFGWFQKKWPLHFASLLLVPCVCISIGMAGLLKGAPDYPALQTNAAITCFTNILHDNNDFEWTICSANDELRMGEDYGYHYELHTFLKEMERSGAYGSITIPTPRVYFFIEKIPIDYSVPYENSGQRVSKDGARRPLPSGSGITMYQGENRWIEMSRMYYWARSFMRMYPNEMQVYYETDDFVCYVLEQEMYSLFNLAIDYGYNLSREPIGIDE